MRFINILLAFYNSAHIIRNRGITCM